MSRRVSWTKVFAGKECTLSVELSRSSNIKVTIVRVAVFHNWSATLSNLWFYLQKKDNYVYPTKFPKPKEEGWILVLGEVETKNVLALKKIGFIRNKTRAQLLFTAPERPGRVIYTLYLMSDSYLNLDQQYEIFLEVEKWFLVVLEILLLEKLVFVALSHRFCNSIKLGYTYNRLGNGSNKFFQIRYYGICMLQLSPLYVCT